MVATSMCGTRPDNPGFTEARVRVLRTSQGPRGHDHPGDGRRRLHRQPHGARAGRRRRARRRARQPLDRLRLGGAEAGARWSSATPATSRWSQSSSPSTGSTRSSISPPRSWCPTRSPIRSATTATTPPTRAALIECAVKGGVKQFIFSSTAAVYGNPDQVPVGEDDPLKPMSPYGSSKLMTEIMLRDAGAAHGLAHVILRYFNVAGADPAAAHRPVDQGRDASDQGRGRDRARPAAEDGGLRHRLSDAGRHLHPRLHPRHAIWCARISDALAYLRSGGASATLNCGYGRGFSVLEVIDTVKRVSGVDFQVETAARRPGDPAQIVAKSDRIRAAARLAAAVRRSHHHRRAMRSPGNASSRSAATAR